MMRKIIWQHAAEAEMKVEGFVNRLLAECDALSAENERLRECATEGCCNSATVHFVRGGIGSHYCYDCYLKVQAVATPPTAAGG